MIRNKIRNRQFDSILNINVMVSIHKERLRIENNVHKCVPPVYNYVPNDAFISSTDTNDYIFVEIEALTDDYVLL